MADSHPLHNDLYSVLGLTAQATSQEIRLAYQHLVGEIVAGHASPVQRQAIEEAFETLGDPIRRLRYDAQASAPAPPRFQMPALRMPGRRITIQMPSVTLRRPHMPRVDPMLAAAVGLVVIVALVVLLLPLIRGRSSNAPAQSVADLVSTPTPTATQSVSSATAPRAASPVLGLNPSGGGTGSLLPLSPSGSPGGLIAPAQPAAGTSARNEPPFLTGSAIIDSLRAVLAASAVRNAPSQAGAPALGAAAPAAVGPNGAFSANTGANTPPNPVPAGVPLTNVGSVPPVVNAAASTSGGASSGAAAPQAAPQATPPPPTATPAANHISIPSGPVGGAAPVSANRAPAPAASPGAGPNRFGPPPAGR